MVQPPTIGTAMSRLDAAVGSLERALDEIGPLRPGEDPGLMRRLNALEDGLDAIISDLTDAMGDQRKSLKRAADG